MKIMHVEAKLDFDVKSLENIVDKLPKSFVFATTVQFVDYIADIVEFFKSRGKEAMLINASHAKYAGQILGCSLFESKGPFFYMGDGLFHPKILKIRTDEDVYAFNPYTDNFFEIGEGDVKVLKGRQKGALVKFYSSDRIGVLVTTKPGQCLYKRAMIFKKRLEAIGKQVYVFIANTIDFNDLENYPDIEIFINTMCPRIAFDDTNKIQKSIINLEDIEGLELQ